MRGSSNGYATLSVVATLIAIVAIGIGIHLNNKNIQLQNENIECVESRMNNINTIKDLRLENLEYAKALNLCQQKNK